MIFSRNGENKTGSGLLRRVCFDSAIFLTERLFPSRGSILVLSNAFSIANSTALLFEIDLLPPATDAAAFPDVAELIIEAAGQTRSLIVDAEIVAIDREDGNRIKAFQVDNQNPRAVFVAPLCPPESPRPCIER